MTCPHLHSPSVHSREHSGEDSVFCECPTLLLHVYVLCISVLGVRVVFFLSFSLSLFHVSGV